MGLRHRGNWLGQSLSFIPRDTMLSIENNFKINEFGFDVSILSDPNTQYCFFFHEKESESGLLNTSLKICEFLKKNLVIIHTGLLDSNKLNHESIIASYNLKENNILPWLDKLSTQLTYLLGETTLSLEEGEQQDQAINKDLIEILRYIDNNLSRTIREEDIADYCHYSVSYFSKIFHHSIGMTFRDYLIQKRIGLAKQLLREDKKTKVAFIAFQCGYKDVSYFTRIFKKKTGVTPASYRHSV